MFSIRFVSRKSRLMGLSVRLSSVQIRPKSRALMSRLLIGQKIVMSRLLMNVVLRSIWIWVDGFLMFQY